MGDMPRRKDETISAEERKRRIMEVNRISARKSAEKKKKYLMALETDSQNMKNEIESLRQRISDMEKYIEEVTGQTYNNGYNCKLVTPLLYEEFIKQNATPKRGKHTEKRVIFNQNGQTDINLHHQARENLNNSQKIEFCSVDDSMKVEPRVGQSVSTHQIINQNLFIDSNHHVSVSSESSDSSDRSVHSPGLSAKPCDFELVAGEN